LCVQEIKALPEQLEPTLREPAGYHSYWHPAGRRGYSGVATFSRNPPDHVTYGLGIERYDLEGRVLQTTFGDFVLLNIYFPNGQKDDERLQYKLDFYQDVLNHVQQLRQQGKHCIVSGDYNTAHKAIDLARPKANETTSGFLPIEREWIDRYIEEGWVDTFRMFCQDPGQYSWWSYRAGARGNNVGWRLDYHFVNKEFTERVVRSYIQPEVLGSDHCPVVIEIDSP
jgi:exodeoxyribonuclease-3